MKALRIALVGLLSIPLLFALCGMIGGAIPRNASWKQADSGVTIMVETNGVHTALVLPLVTPEKDWREDFPAADTGNPAAPYTHVAISWGERRVFLDTPTWSDLSAKTVLHILLGGGEGMLHVAHYVDPIPERSTRPLRISAAEYRLLVRRIEAVVPPRPRHIHAGYYNYDVFYETSGRYTLANTCNQWTSDTLAAAGIRTGRWTPFAGSVMQWVPDLKD